MKIHNILTIIFIFFIKNVFCLTYYKWLINGNKASIMFSSDTRDNNMPTYYYGIIDILEVTNFNNIWFFDGYYYLNIIKAENKYFANFYYNIEEDCNFSFVIYNIYESNGTKEGGTCAFQECKPGFEQICNKAPKPGVSVNMRRENCSNCVNDKN